MISTLIIPTLSYIHNKSVLNRTTLSIPKDIMTSLNLLSTNNKCVFLTQYQDDKINSITRYTDDGSIINIKFMNERLSVTYTKVEYHSFNIELKIDDISFYLASQLIKYHMKTDNIKTYKYDFFANLYNNSIERENFTTLSYHIFYKSRETMKAKQRDKNLLVQSNIIDSIYNIWARYTIKNKLLNQKEVNTLERILDGIDINNFESVIDINNLM